MKTLTVFTPTYNRAYLLPRLYNSLCNQSSQDFLWLVIDDGSTDNTREIVAKWNQEKKIEIHYYYKKNGGMHSGHNKAYKHLETPLNVCIDSDDYMPKTAVADILENWPLIKDKPQFAGLVGLDAVESGEIIGTKIPEHLKSVKLNELYAVHGVKGDKKLVYKTEIVHQYPPYPEYPGEKFVPLDYLYLLIDQDYDLLPVNKVFCTVEYQEDGSTRNILKQYRRHPNGFAFSRVSRIKYGKTLKERFKNAIHLVSSAIFAKKASWLSEAKKPFLIFLALPFGVLLNFYIRVKAPKKTL